MFAVEMPKKTPGACSLCPSRDISQNVLTAFGLLSLPCNNHISSHSLSLAFSFVTHSLLIKYSHPLMFHMTDDIRVGLPFELGQVVHWDRSCACFRWWGTWMCKTSQLQLKVHHLSHHLHRVLHGNVSWLRIPFLTLIPPRGLPSEAIPFGKSL